MKVSRGGWTKAERGWFKAHAQSKLTPLKATFFIGWHSHAKVVKDMIKISALLLLLLILNC